MTDRHSTIRLLYLMHADWRSVWQRSQALATRLHAMPDFELRVLYVPTWRRWQVRKSDRLVPRFPLPQLPFGRRFPLIARLNRALARAALWVSAVAWHPDAVVVPYPEMYAALPDRLRRLPLIYDCMDVARGFARTSRGRRELELAEKELARQAAAVVVSSAYLARHVGPLLPEGRAPALIRNGFDPLVWSTAHSAATARGVGPTRLGYFGMLSTWFDQDIIHRTLDRFTDVEVHLWGPRDVSVMRHERLILHGMVEHAALAREVAEVDAFVMPFVLSDLIEGVDPIKLYEYITFGKPTISVYYPELEHFRGVVEFYGTDDELFAFIERVRRQDRDLVTDSKRVERFLAEATWDRRAVAFADVIRSAVGRQT